MSDYLTSASKTEKSDSVEGVTTKQETSDEPTTEPLSLNLTRTSPNVFKSYDDDDNFQSDTEKPVILEIGDKPISIPTAIYPRDYSFDMHLTAAHPYRHMPTTHYHNDHLVIPPISTHLPPIALYNNPFTTHMRQLSPETTMNPIGAENVSVIASIGSPHISAPLIPQTVSAWPPADTLKQATPEIVPPAVFFSQGLGNSQQHLISKEPNPTWKEKALQIEKDYKKTACDRERTRMRDMNRAFDLLRSKLPITKANGKKYSKIESLRIAINYINHLQQCLREGPPMDNEASDLSTNSASYNHHHQQLQRAIDFSVDIDGRRYGDQFYYHHPHSHRSYQMDMERESDEHNPNSWSDPGYGQMKVNGIRL